MKKEKTKQKTTSSKSKFSDYFTKKKKYVGYIVVFIILLLFIFLRRGSSQPQPRPSTPSTGTGGGGNGGGGTGGGGNFDTSDLEKKIDEGNKGILEGLGGLFDRMDENFKNMFDIQNAQRKEQSQQNKSLLDAILGLGKGNNLVGDTEKKLPQSPFEKQIETSTGNYFDNAFKSIFQAKEMYNNATTQGAKNEAHQRANDMRNMADALVRGGGQYSGYTTKWVETSQGHRQLVVSGGGREWTL